MKKLATLLAASLLIGSAFASTTAPKTKAVNNRYWVINVGAFRPTGDLNDLGVDTGWMASADYHLGTPNEASANMDWFAGIGAFFGSGDNSFDMNAYGVHVGIDFGLGQPGAENPLSLQLKGGVYRNRFDKNGFSDDTETGFGGSAAILYKMKGTSGNNGISLALGYFMLPEVKSTNPHGWFFSVGFPIGGY